MAYNFFPIQLWNMFNLEIDHGLYLLIRKNEGLLNETQALELRDLLFYTL